MGRNRFDDVSFGGKFIKVGTKLCDCSSTIYEANRANIVEVIYSNPATIVLWEDDTKTISKCAPGDIYNPETGLMLCILKKLAGSEEMRRTFNDWLPDNNDNRVKLRDVRKKHKLN